MNVDQTLARCQALGRVRRWGTAPDTVSSNHAGEQTYRPGSAEGGSVHVLLRSLRGAEPRQESQKVIACFEIIQLMPLV